MTFVPLGLTALHFAVSSSNLTKEAKLLIQSGADLNAVDLRNGSTPLDIAIDRGNLFQA